MPRAQDAQERRCTGMYGQIFAPAISALPPSMAVVAAGAGCAGAAMYMDVLYIARAGAHERCMYKTYWQIFAPAISALPPSMAVVAAGAGRHTGMY